MIVCMYVCLSGFGQPGAEGGRGGGNTIQSWPRTGRFPKGASLVSTLSTNMYVGAARNPRSFGVWIAAVGCVFLKKF